MSQRNAGDLEFALAEAGYSLNIDLATIKQQFSILDVAESLTGQDVKKTGNTYRLDDQSCPLCGHNDCFTLYPESNSFHCFSCDENGDVFDLIVKCEQASDVYDAARLLLLNRLEVTPKVRNIVKMDQPVYSAPPTRLQELFNLAACHYRDQPPVSE